MASTPEGEITQRSTLFIAPGVTEPRSRTIHVFSEVPGKIATIHVRTGNDVRKEQLLVELENDAQLAGVEYARAVLDGAAARLQKLRNGDRHEERAALQARVDETEAAMLQAELEVRWI